MIPELLPSYLAWMAIFLYNPVAFRFHVNLLGRMATLAIDGSKGLADPAANNENNQPLLGGFGVVWWNTSDTI